MPFIALEGYGSAASVGVADLFRPLTGQGSAASAGSATLKVALVFAGHGDNATVGQGSLVRTAGATTDTGAAITAKWYAAEDLSSPLWTFDVSKDRRWEEQLSEPGSGTITIPNDQTQPVLGDLVAFNVDGVRAWTMMCEDFTRVAVAPGEESAQLTTWTGRGHLAVCESGVLYPVNGLNGYPKQLDLHFDWRHPDFDDSAWSTPTEVTSVINAQSGGSEQWPIIAWADDMLGGDPGTETQILWASDGGPPSANTAMTIGTVYFRQEFTAPWDGTYIFQFTTDDSGGAWIDGVQVQTTLGGQVGGGFANANVGYARLTAGTHLLAVECRNWPAFPGILNLAGAAWNLLTPGYTSAVMICNSRNASGTYQSAPVMMAYPLEPPGMSPGEAIRLALESIQARDDNPLGFVSLGFTDTHDSDGNAWNVTPAISTKVLTDFLTFLREVSASYCDIRMDPSSFRLDAWNYGTMGGSSGLTFAPGTNLTGLEQKGRYKLANVLIGDFQGQYLEVQDTSSVSTNGRHEAQFAIGSVDTVEEATRVLEKALLTFGDTREEINAAVAGPVGYVDYELGDTALVQDSTETYVSERVTAILVSEDDDNGRVLTMPTLRDLIL